MDSQENQQKDYRRTFRASLVPHSKSNRWSTINQSHKDGCETKSGTVGLSSGQKVKCRELVRKEVSKKPPFVVPGIVRSNDNFFKSESLPKNPIKKPVMNRRPLYPTKPTPIASHFSNATNKPISSGMPKISISQSDQTLIKTSQTPPGIVLAAPTGLKIVEPVSILKKSPSRKPDGDGVQVSNGDSWITFNQGLDSVQEKFQELSQKQGFTAAPRVSFLDEKSEKNIDSLSYWENLRSPNCFGYLDRQTASKSSSNSSVTSESDVECESHSNFIVEQKNRWGELSCDSVSEETAGMCSSKEETKLLIESELKLDTKCVARDNPGSISNCKGVGSLCSVQEETTKNYSLSYENIDETNYLSHHGGNPSQSSSFTKLSFSDEDTHSLDETRERSDTLEKRDLSQTISSTEESLSKLHLTRQDSNSSFSDEIARFRQRLDAENSRLKNLCLIWERELEENIPPLETGNVLTVIRQTQQLQREKFNQYADLVNQFENKSGKKIVVNDLEGFWELIQLQVCDVDKKFAELEQLKKNDWVRKELIVPPKKRLKKKVVTTPRGLRSNIRVHIAAARKKQYLPKRRKSFSFLDRATPLLRTPVLQDWNVMRTGTGESDSPIPLVRLPGSVHKIDETAVKDLYAESFFTEVTIAAGLQSPTLSSPMKTYNSSHHRTSTPQFSSERMRTAAGLESTIKTEDKEENNNETWT